MHRFGALGHAQLLIEVTDMGFNGGSGNIKLAGDLIVAVAGVCLLYTSDAADD